MSDPNKKLESINVDAAPAPPAKSSTTAGGAKGIAANDANYPPYLLNVCDTAGAVIAHIDGPHTSAAIDIGPPSSHVRVRVIHLDTASGPNLQVFVERV